MAPLFDLTPCVQAMCVPAYTPLSTHSMRSCVLLTTFYQAHLVAVFACAHHHIMSHFDMSCVWVTLCVYDINTHHPRGLPQPTAFRLVRCAAITSGFAPLLASEPATRQPVLITQGPLRGLSLGCSLAAVAFSICMLWLAAAVHPQLCAVLDDSGSLLCFGCVAAIV